jgi:hypothetical protein
MEIDQLRDGIWDYLFEHKTSKSFGELAVISRHDVTEIRIAVNHEWFKVAGEDVSIAFSNSPSA